MTMRRLLSVAVPCLYPSLGNTVTTKNEVNRSEVFWQKDTRSMLWGVYEWVCLSIKTVSSLAGSQPNGPAWAAIDFAPSVRYCRSDTRSE